MPNRILLLSYAFPPISAPEAFLSAKAMGSIPGYLTDVLCADATKNHLVADYTLDEYVRKNFSEIVRISSPYIVKRLSKRLPFVCQMPDFFRFLNGNLLRRVAKMDLSQYKAIVSWSQWHSVHLAALEIKKRNPNIKWMAHFSDPWVDNSFVKYDILTSSFNNRMESDVIKGSDALLFTSPETIELVMRKYPAPWKKKAFYVPHCFDKALYSKGEMPPEGTYVVRSIGNFCGPRSPKPLYEAIERIAAGSPKLLEGVLFELVGSLAEHGNLLDRYPLAKARIHIRRSVSYVDSLRLMQSSHCLLAIDAPAQTSVFFPSKLVDYIGAERFVMAISPKGATARIVEEIGGLCVDPQDIDMVTSKLKDVLIRRPSATNFTNDKYAKEKVTKDFLKILDT